MERADTAVPRAPQHADAAGRRSRPMQHADAAYPPCSVARGSGLALVHSSLASGRGPTLRLCRTPTDEAVHPARCDTATQTLGSTCLRVRALSLVTHLTSQQSWPLHVQRARVVTQLQPAVRFRILHPCAHVDCVSLYVQSELQWEGTYIYCTCKTCILYSVESPTPDEYTVAKCSWSVMQ